MGFPRNETLDAAPAAASTGAPLQGVTALTNGPGSFAIVSLDQPNPADVVHALHRAGFTSVETHTRD